MHSVVIIISIITSEIDIPLASDVMDFWRPNTINLRDRKTFLIVFEQTFIILD
jgi:hypothetical protein